MSEHNTNYKEHLFFGRRSGRPLKKGSKKAVEHILPLLQFNTENLDQDVQNYLNEANEQSAETWLEIGFGAGEHFSGLMNTYQNHYFLGCEPFMNGVAHCLKSLDKTLPQYDYTKRARIWTDSAELLLDKIPDESLERIYLLNPDPWPKTRHHKRRFVRSENLDELSRVLKPNGLFITATDVGELAEWMLEKTLNHGAFKWLANSKADWQNRPDDWITTTRYAEKGELAGRQEIYLRFQKR